MSPGAAVGHEMRELLGDDLAELFDARRAVELATTRAPAHVSRALVHADFCPDNLVVGNRGSVHVIDNETVNIHAPEYDLARTWYRWPMTPEQWGHYAEGYGDRPALESFVRHFAHWAVIVLVEASLFHLRGGTPEADYPLRRLQQVLRTPIRTPGSIRAVLGPPPMRPDPA